MAHPLIFFLLPGVEKITVTVPGNGWQKLKYLYLKS